MSVKKKYNKIVAYKEFFNSPKGKAVLLDLIDIHYGLSSTFDPNPYEMSRKEGERNVVLRILTLLKVSPTQMQALAEEIDKDVERNPDQPNSPTINW